jgi:hypothetical protein
VEGLACAQAQRFDFFAEGNFHGGRLRGSRTNEARSLRALPPSINKMSRL